MTKIRTLVRAGATLACLLLAAALVLATAWAPAALADGTVTVSLTGQGSASGPGINCTHTGGPDCSEFYADTTTQDCDPERKPPCFDVIENPYVELTAGADSNGYVFNGWTGCDGVNGRTCSLTVTENTGLTAGFRDNQAPGVSAVSPSGVQRGSIALGANASDNSGAVNRVEFRVRGVLVASDSSAPYSTSFNTTTIADGGATVRATAFDAAGNSSFAESSITIDNTAPTLNVTGGPNGQTYGAGSTQTWTFSASDATSGLAAVQCSVVAAGAPASFGACSGGSSSHSVSNRPDGNYVFSVRSRDNAGLETTQSRTFSIDATPPETTITGGPADGSSSSDTSATFTFTASQGGSNFECRVYPAALTPGAFAPCSGDGSHSASGFSPGTYSFEVRATDPYGNADGSPAKRTFTVTPTTTGGGGTDGGGGGGGGGGTGGGDGGGTTTTDGGGGGGGGTTTVTGGGKIDARVSTFWTRFGSKTRVNRLTVSGAPVGATVTVTCKGKGCAFKRLVVPVKGASLALAGKFKKRKLGAKSVITVLVSKPGMVAKSFRWTTQAKKFPKVTIT